MGVEEWGKIYAEHENLGKKAVLFVMVDDTKNCDEVGEYLQRICPELQEAVLVIHTKNNGEISEASSGKSKEELDWVSEQANAIHTWSSPRKAIVCATAIQKCRQKIRKMETLCNVISVSHYRSVRRIRLSSPSQVKVHVWRYLPNT